MGKRGVSPLIAWVLLIGLAIAIGVAVINWAIDVTPEPDVDLSYCDDVSISLIQYESPYVPGNVGLDFTIVNNGYFSVDRLTFGFSHSSSVSPVIWCDWLIQKSPERDGLLPGSQDVYEIDLAHFDEDCEESTTGQGVPNPDDVKKVVIIPWISIDGQTLNCNDRKLEFAVDMFQE